MCIRNLREPADAKLAVTLSHHVRRRILPGRCMFGRQPANSGHLFMLSTAAQSHLCGHESYQLSNSSTRSFSTPSSIIRNKTLFITARTQLDVDQPLKKWLIGYLAVCRKELNTDNEVRGAAVTLAGLISFKSPR